MAPFFTAPTTSFTAGQLRDWADSCAAAVEQTFDRDEKDQLLLMQEGLLQLAENEDWLKGIRAL